MHHLAFPESLNPARRLGADEARDYGLLDSALARPQPGVFGRDACPDVWRKAPALMAPPARDHTLVDGNERIACCATWVFLHLNGHPLDSHSDVDEAERFVLDVCQGALHVSRTVAQLPRFAR